MSEQVLNTINEIIYYINEYKNNNPEVGEDVMRMIAKETKKLAKKNYLELVFYRSLIGIIKAKAVIYSSTIMEDERFIDLTNNYLLDLYMYYEYSNYLKQYINECLKNRDYEHLDDAYILGVKLIELVGQLNLYIQDIDKVFKENTRSFYASYPKNDYTDLNNRKNEIELIVKKLKKDPE